MSLPVVGFRHWRVTPDQQLVPVAIGVAVRPRLHREAPGAWNGPHEVRAACLAGNGHQAPHHECVCGFHAYNEPDPLYTGSRFMVEGIILAAGRLQVHEGGFRAERARILALLSDPVEPESWMVRLARQHGVPLVPQDQAWGYALEYGERCPPLVPA